MKNESTPPVDIPVILRRSEAVAALRKLLPLRHEAEAMFHHLAMNSSWPAWKDLFIRFWQTEAQGAAELEWKIRELGGESETAYWQDSRESNRGETKVVDPFFLDKTLILRCVNHHADMVQRYADVRRSPLPVDLRMILQRHELQAREVLDQLAAINLTYSPRSLNAEKPASFVTRPNDVF